MAGACDPASGRPRTLARDVIQMAPDAPEGPKIQMAPDAPEGPQIQMAHGRARDPPPKSQPCPRPPLPPSCRGLRPGLRLGAQAETLGSFSATLSLAPLVQSTPKARQFSYRYVSEI